MKTTNKPITMWIVIAALLVATGLMIRWQYTQGVDNVTIDSLIKVLHDQQIADSVNILHLKNQIYDLKDQNNALEAAIVNNGIVIEKLKIASTNQQYETYLYDANETKEFFMDKTGGGSAELIERNQDTLMITPIENIKDANIKMVELSYTIQERDEYIKMTENLNQEIENLDEIIFIKDSIITIKDDELVKSNELIGAFQQSQEKKDKAIKRAKTKTWIIAGAGAAGIIILSLLN